MISCARSLFVALNSKRIWESDHKSYVYIDRGLLKQPWGYYKGYPDAGNSPVNTPNRASHWVSSH
jgi:hypothetical protein